MLCSASLEVGEAGALPAEFRIFKAGVNETSKGPILFDEEAAAAVLAQYQKEGVDPIVDLEHLSLDRSSPSYDPDARAHYQLAVRGGELWAVNVRWTEDGERRLSKKTQRYISPAALADPKTGRVKRLLNVALVAQPATYGAAPLVAASKHQVASPGPACHAVRRMLEIAILSKQAKKSKHGS